MLTLLLREDNAAIGRYSSVLCEFIQPIAFEVPEATSVPEGTSEAKRVKHHTAPQIIFSLAS